MIGKRSKLTWLMVSLSAVALAGCEWLIPETVTGDPELKAFGSCSELESYVQLEALDTSEMVVAQLADGEAYEPFGFVNASSLAGGVTGTSLGAGTEYSSTNNQEEGVHESDIVQADATDLYVLRGDRLYVLAAISATQRNVATRAILDIPGDPLEMILGGDRLVVFTRTGQSDVLARYASIAATRPSDNSVLTALVYDVSDSSNPQLVREVSADGEFVAARRVGGSVYMVARAALGSTFAVPEDEDPDDWLMQETARIGASSFDTWMPYVYNVSYDAGAARAATGGRPSCTTAFRSETASGTSALAIVSFDVYDLDVDVETTTIFGDGTLVYASADAILLAQTNYIAEAGRSMTSGAVEFTFGDEASDAVDVIEGFGAGDPVTGAATDIHRFDLTPEGARYRSSGRVPGFPLNVFALDEHNEQVRVVTHEATDLEGTNVFVLDDGYDRRTDPLMLAVDTSEHGTMDIVGSLTELAPTEDLYGVRFVDDYAYVVTFEQVDPLWVIDLTRPTVPQLRGELEVTGWSSYLHPIEGGRLLAVGSDRRDNGNLKVSLFDVSDPDRPDAINEIVSRGYESFALEDHRAFRYLERAHLLAVPADGREHQLQFFDVERNSLRSLGTMTQSVSGGTAPILRSYQIGDYLYVYSTAAISAVNIETLETSDTVRF